MDYCGPRGIPLDTFLEWPETSQDAALAWQTYDRQRCGGCGTHPDEWDPATGGSHDAYHAKEGQCPGCARKQVVERQLAGAANTPPGMRVRLIPWQQTSSGEAVDGDE